MKKIIKALELQLMELNSLISFREATFNIRSANWQISRKGELYDMATGEIANQAEELKAIIDNLNDL